MGSRFGEAEVIKVELPPRDEHIYHIWIVPKDGNNSATIIADLSGS